MNTSLTYAQEVSCKNYYLFITTAYRLKKRKLYISKAQLKTLLAKIPIVFFYKNIYKIKYMREDSLIIGKNLLNVLKADKTILTKEKNLYFCHIVF